jgi:proteic killer suppression protein
MRVRFADKALEALEIDLQRDGNYAPGIGQVFRKRMQMIRAAPDERVFRNLKSLHYEKLKGDRAHQRSMKLNDKWRLIVEPEEEGAARVIAIVAIEDYH